MVRTKDEAEEHLKKLRAIKKTPLLPAGTTTNGKTTPTRKRLSDAATGGIKKPHRYRSGTRALMEIRKYQRMDKFATAELLPTGPFYRLVKEVMGDLKPELRIKKAAFRAIKQAAESRIVQQMQTANLAAIHAGRQGITPDDIRVANLIRATDRGLPIETTQPSAAKFRPSDEQRVKRKEARDGEKKPKKAKKKPVTAVAPKSPKKRASRTVPQSDASAVDESTEMTVDSTTTGGGDDAQTV